MVAMMNRIKSAISGGKANDVGAMDGSSAPQSALDAAPRSALDASPQSALDASAEPVSLQHVWTPESNAVKLQINRMIMPLGEKRSYPDPATALESPLAQALFEIDGVAAVDLDGVSVQVFMDDDADWDALMERIPEVVKRHLDSGLAAVEGIEPASGRPEESSTEKKFGFGFREIPESSRSPEEQKEIVQRLLDDEINPAVAAHGGYFTLIAVEDNNVYVPLGGGCQGCGMADVTLRQGVEQRMKEALPEMHELIDVTDHRAGDNPYYQPGK